MSVKMRDALAGEWARRRRASAGVTGTAMADPVAVADGGIAVAPLLLLVEAGAAILER